MAWKTQSPPQNGMAIRVRVEEIRRFLPYSPKSQQARRGILGRWQKLNEYGGWDNCPTNGLLEWDYDTDTP